MASTKKARRRWKCTTKARGTCPEQCQQVFSGVGPSKQDAKNASERAGAEPLVATLPATKRTIVSADIPGAYEDELIMRVAVMGKSHSFKFLDDGLNSQD